MTPEFHAILCIASLSVTGGGDRFFYSCFCSGVFPENSP
jgi:hypothetical protein